MKHYKKLMRTWLITGSIMTAIPVIARMTVATMFTTSVAMTSASVLQVTRVMSQCLCK